ncbi:hypothetical protein [Dactylosporangium sp. NPDC051484]|uniref:hypothetical protein n=1 Tax=Dactylosporangium sp. NPDC051484 TaxID=3154942 RepID=UPI00344C61DC
MEELTVTRWRKYGKDRLYVSTPGGTRVGWHDLLSGETHVEATADRDTVMAAIAHWRENASPTADNVVVTQRGAAAPPAAEPAPGDALTAVRPHEPTATDVETTSTGTESIASQSSPAICDEPAAAVEDWEDLALRRAGAEAREQAVALRQAAPVRTFLARVLGVHTACGSASGCKPAPTRSTRPQSRRYSRQPDDQRRGAHSRRRQPDPSPEPQHRWLNWCRTAA